jgi:hypothetical protein
MSVDLSKYAVERKYYTMADIKAEPFTGRIVDITEDEMNGEKKTVTWFENHQKGVVNNGRRNATLLDMFGSAKNAVGKRVRVETGKVEGKSGRVDTVVYREADEDSPPF